jgi:hypothetical protein
MPSPGMILHPIKTPHATIKPNITIIPFMLIIRSALCGASNSLDEEDKTYHLLEINLMMCGIKTTPITKMNPNVR